MAVDNRPYTKDYGPSTIDHRPKIIENRAFNCIPIEHRPATRDQEDRQVNTAYA